MNDILKAQLRTSRKVCFRHGSKRSAVYQIIKQKCNYKLELSENSLHKYNEINCQDDQSNFAECIEDTNGRDLKREKIQLNIEEQEDKRFFLSGSLKDNKYFQVIIQSQKQQKQWIKIPIVKDKNM